MKKQHGQHARLSLYLGLCSARNCTEGVFVEPEYGDQDLRYNRALDTVYEFLFLGGGRRVQTRPILGRYPPLAPSEKQARQVIDYCESNIQGAHGVVRLDSCGHGKIHFLRVVDFDEFRDADSLITQIEGCGYVPHDEERERTWRIMKESTEKLGLAFNKPPPDPHDMWRAHLSVEPFAQGKNRHRRTRIHTQ